MALALLACCVIVAGVEFAYRATGGTPSVIAGMTGSEFAWRLGNLEADERILAIGDSRVGWGFAERPFNEALARAGHGVRGVNLGVPASGVAAIMQAVLATQPAGDGVLLINYSAGSLFHFGANNLIVGGKLQDMLDDRLGMAVKEHVYTLGRDGQHVGRTLAAAAGGAPVKQTTYVSRTRYEDGFIQAHLAGQGMRPIDRTKYQLDHYKVIIDKLLAAPHKLKARLAELDKAMAKARASGRKIVLMRLPRGPRMRVAEDRLPRHLTARALADRWGVVLLDYELKPQTRALETLDQSHLTPKSARAMAAALAADISSILGKP